MGQAPSGDTYNDEGEGLPLIAGASDFGSQTPQPSRFTTVPGKISQIGDIILCVRATIGDLNWSDKRYCLGRGVASLRVMPGRADARYMWRAIEAYAAQLSAMGRGACKGRIGEHQTVAASVGIMFFRERISIHDMRLLDPVQDHVH
jgi:type I restriction enzyme S subunit